MNKLEDDAIEVLLAVSESWMQVHLEYRGGEKETDRNQNGI